MTFLPAYPETLVLPYPAEEIYRKLLNATSNKPFIQAEEGKLFFNGWVKPDRFRVSRRIHRTNYYVPLIGGRIESTSSGCIIFLKYRLFPSTRYLLTFWILVIPLCSLVIARSLLTFTISIAVVGLLYAIVWYNFKIQSNVAREIIHQVLNNPVP